MRKVIMLMLFSLFISSIGMLYLEFYLCLIITLAGLGLFVYASYLRGEIIADRKIRDLEKILQKIK